MFESLSDRLSGIFDKLTRRGSLTDSDVAEAMREVRRALLEADVALEVVRSFTDAVKAKAVGQAVIKSITPGQMVVKIVHDELVSMLGSDAQPIDLVAQPPVPILLVGLQGSGKTTTCAKIGYRLTNRDKKKVLMASLDVARPAAQEQLAVLGRQTDPDPATGPLALGPVPVPAAASADCARLLSGLPGDIDTGDGLLPRRALADPVPAGTVAWGGEKEASGRPEDQPVVLRCGLAAPPELGPTSPLLDVDGVAWLRIPGAGTSTWVTADRAVFVGLTLPDGIGSAAIQDVSRGVKITLVSRDTTPPAPAPTR